jgi:hypothetical protein
LLPVPLGVLQQRVAHQHAQGMHTVKAGAQQRIDPARCDRLALVSCQASQAAVRQCLVHGH